MPIKMSSTRLLAHGLNRTARIAAHAVGHRKALKILGHLRYLLRARETFTVGRVTMSLYVLDRHGTYWVLRGPDSEPETLAWIDSFEADDVFYDIGANVGFYSVYAGLGPACRCVALEPNPFSYDALIQNTLANRLQDRLMALCLAVGDEEGVFGLGIVSDQSGAVGSTLAADGDDRTQVAALVTRLDTLVASKGMPFPTHLKIDVDGIEESVLAGARSVLADGRLKSVLVEICDRTEAERAALRSRIEAGGLALAEGESSGLNWIFRRP